MKLFGDASRSIQVIPFLAASLLRQNIFHTFACASLREKSINGHFDVKRQIVFLLSGQSLGRLNKKKGDENL